MRQFIRRIILLFIILCMALPALTFCENEPVTSVVFSGTEAVIDGEGAKLKKDCLTISKGGCYTLSGAFSGRVKVEAEEQKVVLILAGADISSEDRCPLLIKEASSVVLILQDGTLNRLYSGAENDEDTDEEDGDEESKGANALKCSCPLRIEGGGTLEMTSGRNGISGKDSVTVADGKLTIICGNDGIHLSGKDEACGTLSVEGGNLGITCDGDGMQADTVRVSGGVINLLCGGGNGNAAPRSSSFGGRNGMPWGHPDTDTETEEANCKGIKSETLISISGGNIFADTQDDAIHSNGKIIISGGKTVLSAGDDGAHADTYLEISGGSLDITKSYEGLEAHHIEITGGDISVRASDDGMNANGGSNGFGFGGPGGGFGGRGGFDPDDRNSPRNGRGKTGSASQRENTEQPGGKQFPDGMTPPDGLQMPDNMIPPDGMQFPGMPKEQQSAAADDNGENEGDEMPLLHISGGNIIVNAEGDGLDSNGDLIIDGGSILVHGPVNGGNGALDSGMENGGILQINGGTVMAYGAADMAESFDESSAQSSVTYTSATRFPADTIVTLLDGSGSEIYKALLSKTCSSVILSSPDMEVGKTFTLKIGSVTETFTIENTVTYLGKGRPYTGFGGGFGGGFGR